MAARQKSCLSHQPEHFGYNPSHYVRKEGSTLLERREGRGMSGQKPPAPRHIDADYAGLGNGEDAPGEENGS